MTNFQREGMGMFTDEDLARLKLDIEIGGVVWKAPFFGPLLARLEAAEAVMKWAIEGGYYPSRQIEAWRRTKGEDDSKAAGK